MQFPIGTGFYWGIGFIGPGFIGLDAKILRPYKQMICVPKQMILLKMGIK
jgi:hypothetical protein